MISGISLLAEASLEYPQAIRSVPLPPLSLPLPGRLVLTKAHSCRNRISFFPSVRFSVLDTNVTGQLAKTTLVLKA